MRNLLEGNPMLKRLLLLLAVGLISLPASAQDAQATPAEMYVGYVSCPVRQTSIFLYQSLKNFDVIASPKCDERVVVLGQVDTLGGYLRIRTADGKEGYVPQHLITTTAPAQPRIAAPAPPPPPVPAGQAPVLAGPLSHGPSNFGYDVPRAEFFGGYSYLNADWEGLASRSGLHGWNGSAGINVNPWLGVEGSASGNYQRNCIGASGLTCTILTFMGGPRITAYRGAGLSAFGHGLVGIGNLTMTLAGSSLTWRDLAWAVGGGADYAVNNRISVRVGQVDYVRTQLFQSLGGTHQNNIRVSAGVVIRVGKIVTE
jgi:opacity protein-like surface antigen